MRRDEIYERVVVTLLEGDQRRKLFAPLSARAARGGLEVLASLFIQNGLTSATYSQAHSLLLESRRDWEKDPDAQQAPNVRLWWQEVEDADVGVEGGLSRLLNLSLLSSYASSEETDVDESDAEEPDVSGTPLRFLHESFRDYLASGCVEPAWSSDDAFFDRFNDPAWEDAVVFAVERTGSRGPLLHALRDPDLNKVIRTQAARLLGRVGQPGDVADMLRALSTSDPLLLDHLGHTLSIIFSRSATEEFQATLLERLQDWTDAEASTSDERAQAAKLVRGIGLGDGGAGARLLLPLMRKGDSDVRADALLALQNVSLDSAFLDAAFEACLDSEPAVREVGWLAVLSASRCRCSEEFHKRVQETVDAYRSGSGFREPSGQFVLLNRLGRTPLDRWQTEILLEYLLFSDTEAAESDKVLRWWIARHLCHAAHRRYFREADNKRLRELAQSTPVDAPLRAVLDELLLLVERFDEQKTHPSAIPEPPFKYLPQPADTLNSTPAQEFWNGWRDELARARASYISAYDNAAMSWGCVQAAYGFFSLSPMAQKRVRAFLSGLLDSSAREGAAKRDAELSDALALMSVIGLPDSHWLGLRHKALDSPDAHVRHAAVTSPSACAHHRLAPRLLRLFRGKKGWDTDPAVRWDAAVSLLGLVGEPVLGDLAEALAHETKHDPHPLVRGLIAERLCYFGEHAQVRGAFKKALGDRNAYVRARVLRSYTRLADAEGIVIIEGFLSSTDRTKLGKMNQIARDVLKELKRK